MQSYYKAMTYFHCLCIANMQGPLSRKIIIYKSSRCWRSASSTMSSSRKAFSKCTGCWKTFFFWCNRIKQGVTLPVFFLLTNTARIDDHMPTPHYFKPINLAQTWKKLTCRLHDELILSLENVAAALSAAPFAAVCLHFPAADSRQSSRYLECQEMTGFSGLPPVTAS